MKMTNQDTEQYIAFIEKLEFDEHRLAALNDMKIFFTYKSPSEIVEIIRSIGIAKLIHSLNSPSKDQVELTCQILSLCFDKFLPAEVLKTFPTHIMYMLRHENDCVRRLAIDEVSKTVSTNSVLLPLPKFIDIFVATAQMVCDNDVGISAKAVSITSLLPGSACEKVLEEMKISLECDNSSKCNAFEVIVNISSKSYELFQLCVGLGYIDFMINELQSDDVLYKLNILELLSNLGITPYGINHLIKNGILDNISQLIRGLPQNPFGGLLTPGFMKFSGAIAHYYPNEIFQNYPILLEFLFNALDSNDATILPVALDTLGFIGKTWEGKMCLMTLGSQYTQVVENLGLMIRNSPTDIKVRALHCIANLIGIDGDPKAKVDPVDHRVTLMTREWFRSLSKQPMSIEVLFLICKNPFLEIKLAGYTLLDAVCQHRWGEEMVARAAGFIEYLLDRSIDLTKESKEAKYDIIKRLSHSTAFDENITMRIQKYVEEGPFYSNPETQVAVEGE